MQEVIDSAFKEIGDWSIKLALHPINAPPISCGVIAALDSKKLELMTFESFEDLLNIMSSYNIYVKAQKGSIEAQVEIIQGELNKAMYLETNNLGIDYKYKNIEEKIAVVRTIKPEIDIQYRRLLILKAQLARIKDVPFAIDKKIEILRAIYNRRINNEQPKRQ